MVKRSKLASYGAMVLSALVLAGCTSVHRYWGNEYRQNPDVLSDGERVRVVTAEGPVVEGHILHRGPDALTIAPIWGEIERTIPVESLVYVETIGISPGRTVGGEILGAIGQVVVFSGVAILVVIISFFAAFN